MKATGLGRFRREEVPQKQSRRVNSQSLLRDNRDRC